MRLLWMGGVWLLWVGVWWVGVGVGVEGAGEEGLLELVFSPPAQEDSFRFNVTENTVSSLYLNLSSDAVMEVDFITVSSDNTDIATPVNRTFNVKTVSMVEDLENISIPIRGVFVGKTDLMFKFYGRNDSQVKVSDSEGDDSNIFRYPMYVLRSKGDEKLSNGFAIMMGILMVGNTFIMGLQLDWKIILSVVKKPVAPAIAAAWGSLLLMDKPNLKFGFFAVGCSPGGGPSNMWTLLLDGNLDLSVTMTFFSNIAALAMMPFWIYTLGGVFYQGKISIPFSNILLSLFLMIGPVFLGILVKHFKPTWGKKTEKLVKLSSLLVLLIALPFGIYANLFIFKMITGRTLLCGLLLPYTGFVVAFVLAKLVGQGLREMKTVAIETGIQNASVAMVLLNFSLPKPHSDLSLVMPLCVIIFTPLPLVLILVISQIKKCIDQRRNPKEKEEKGDSSAPTAPATPSGDKVAHTQTTIAIIDSTGMKESAYENKALELDEETKTKDQSKV